MNRKWTPAQEDAINAQGGSVIVSAAAGSGKTAVLVERVLNRITNPDKPIDIDNLLIVTYTRAAAAEMKERISKELELLAKQFPEQAYYRKQLMLLPKANISTIHSFCGNLIKENFYLMDDIPAGYKIADESSVSIIKNQAVENIIEELYETGDRDFRLAADCFSTAKGEYNFKDIILNIYEFLCSQAFPQEWMSRTEQFYEEENVSNSVWGKAILNEAALACDFILGKIDEAVGLFNNNPEIGSGIIETINNNYRPIAERLFDLVNAGNWDGLYNFCHIKHDFGRLTAARGYASHPVKVRIAGICSVIKSVIIKNISKLFIHDSEEYRSTTKIAKPVVKTLFKVVRLFDKEYKRLKLEEGLADFSDLEHWTLDLLYNNGNVTTLAEELSNSFCEVMVDEYQDANEVQDLIFNSVSDNGKKLFVVGDVKQSIYRFRQANPELFLRRKNSYLPYSSEFDNYPAKIVLDRNFRSRSGITKTVNFIFSKLMSPQTGDMYYGKEDMLTCASSFHSSDTPDSNLLLIFAPSSSQIPIHIAEARLISKKILEMMKSFEVEDNGVKRSPRFSDFAILLRTNTHAPDYTNTLKSFGIPVECQSGDNYLDTNEISVIISLLKVINNPLLDVPMLNVLTSPIFAFTPTELANIRLDSKSLPLYKSVVKCAENGDKHCIDFCRELSSFRIISTSCSLDELVEEIYTRTAYPEIISSTDGGNIKLNNLRLFQQHAAKYSESGGGLSSYIRYLDRLIEQNIPLHSSQTDSGPNRVQIMTIHSSKGLEFPICFVAGISSPKHNDVSQLLAHSKLGVGAAINHIEGPFRIESVQKQAIEMQIDIDDVSEELRVLYVACTRAKEKLFMISSFRNGNPEKAILELASTVDLENKRIHPYMVRNYSSSAQRLAACSILYGKNKGICDILDMPCEIYSGSDEDFWQSEIIIAENISMSDGVDAEKLFDNRNFNISMDEIKRRLSLKYMNDGLTKVPVKISVSELVHKGEERSYAFSSRPAFLLDGNITAAQKGTAMHAFMQFADYSAFLTNPTEEIKRLTDNHFLTQNQAKVIDVSKVNNCLNSYIMTKYLSAEKTYREYRFAVKVKASDIYNEISTLVDAEMLLQGAVDCAFVEDDKITIIDYKTDKVENMDELKERYSKQLNLYSYAMRISTGLEVSKCIIYSFYLDSAIEV